MRFSTIKDIPSFIGQPKVATVRIFQWPNESYSLFVRRPTKRPSRTSQGMLIGTYFDLEKAHNAARAWLTRHRGWLV
jgi:hypothetical protein